MVSSMDDCLALILSTDLTEISTMITKLKKLESKLITKTGENQDPLLVLDPKLHSVGFLCILLARLGEKDADLIELLPIIHHFVNSYDPISLSFAMEQVTLFYSTIVERYATAGSLPAVVILLQCLVARLGATPGTITPLHVPFMNLCLQSRNYRVGAELAYCAVDIDMDNFPVKYLDILTYHYYCAVIFGIQSEYKLAIDALEFVISAPGAGVSAIQIDSYKKLVLFQLLVNGKTSPIPKYTATAVSAALKNHCTPYSDFVEAYEHLDISKCKQLMDRFRESYDRDFNYGIIVRCYQNIANQLIQQLTKTYYKLSLDAVTVHLGYNPKEHSDFTRQKLLTMFARREIYGSIEEVGGKTIVTFTGDLESHNSQVTVDRLTRSIYEVNQRQFNSSVEDSKIARSKDFVQKAFNSSAAVQQSSGMAIMDELDVGDGDFGSFED